MTTTSLGLINSVENTLQPGLAHNFNMDLLNAMIGGNVTREFAADANITLTAAEYQTSVLVFTDSPSTLTTGRDVVFPAAFPHIVCVNNTAQTLTLKKSGQTGVTLAAAATCLVASGPTDVIKVVS